LRQHKTALATDVDQPPAQAAGVALGHVEGLAARPGEFARGQAERAVGVQAVVRFLHGVLLAWWVAVVVVKLLGFLLLVGLCGTNVPHCNSQ